MSKTPIDAEKCVSQWSPPPEKLELGVNEIHVWRASLDADESHLHGLEQTLSEDERDRADRFYFRKDRESFIAGRGLLRTILARYLGTDASGLQFCCGAHGKPALAAEHSTQRLCFNVSYSCGLALLAFARGRNLGVDVEHVRPHLADENIVEQFFSPREIVALRALPGHIQPEAFFCCWTRKEAYLKAIGKGLALRLNLFDVPVHSVRHASLVGSIESYDRASRWSIWHLAPAPNYVGALAFEESNCEIKCRQLVL